MNQYLRFFYIFITIPSLLFCSTQNRPWIAIYNTTKFDMQIMLEAQYTFEENPENQIQFNFQDYDTIYVQYASNKNSNGQPVLDVYIFFTCDAQNQQIIDNVFFLNKKPYHLAIKSILCIQNYAQLQTSYIFSHQPLEKIMISYNPEQGITIEPHYISFLKQSLTFYDNLIENIRTMNSNLITKVKEYRCKQSQ
jgi:hypothetical protein